MFNHLEYINGTLCIHGGWLYGEGGIMTFPQYKHMIARHQVVIIQRGGNGRVAWLKYDSLSARYRQIYELKHGNPHVQAAKSFLEDRIELDGEAFRVFQEYTFDNGRHLPKTVITEYAHNASVLNAVGKLMKLRTETSRSGVGGKFSLGVFWKEMAREVANLNPERWKHSLYLCDSRLKKRYMEYAPNKYETLVHGNYCNTHAAKVVDDEKKSLLTELIGDGRNMDNAEVARLYNEMAAIKCWDKITASAVGIWRSKLDLVTFAGRRGKTQFRNVKTMQVTRSRPSAAMYYWTVDGWDAELIYQAKVEKKRTAYHHKLTIVVILDPCVDYPVGYAIGDHETSELITAALRNAIDHIRELFGQRYCPYQLQSDHYGKGCMTPIFESITKHYTPAQVKNAKSKVIESWFDRFNHKHLRFMPNWSGHNVTSNKKNQPNGEMLDACKRNFPDEAGCRRQLETAIAAERKEYIERYREFWTKTPEDKKMILSDDMYLNLFGAITGEKSRLQPDGLRVTIEGKLYKYDCFDIRFREHSYLRWTVKYDPNDLSHALAVNDDGTLRFMLEQKYVQPMALADRKEGDGEQLERVYRFNNTLEKDITERRAMSAEITQGTITNSPETNDTLVKFMLTDSRGQHKDVRNEHRVRQIPVQVAVAATADGDEDYEVVFDRNEFRRNNY